MSQYYTYISVNRKSVKVEESEQEHQERMTRIRKAQFAQKMAEEQKAKGIHKTAAGTIAYKICPKCKNRYPYSSIPKYNECPKCAIVNMYN